MPTNKYVQLHPTNEATNEIDESVNLYPVIGPDSFKDFVPSSDPEVFKPQEKLVSGTNIKSITIGNDVNTLLQESAAPAGTLNLNSYLLNLLYPVGSIYMSAVANETDEDICPIAALGGTWERIKDRFLWAKGDGDTVGDTAGSKDAVVVLHSHTVTGGVHTHPVTIDDTTLKSDIVMRPMYDTNGARIQNFPFGFENLGSLSITYTEKDADTVKNSYETDPWIAGETKCDTLHIDATHKHTATVQANSGSHTHTVSTEGVSGEGKNMPPYLVVMAWKRVA